LVEEEKIFFSFYFFSKKVERCLVEEEKYFLLFIFSQKK